MRKGQPLTLLVSTFLGVAKVCATPSLTTGNEAESPETNGAGSGNENRQWRILSATGNGVVPTELETFEWITVFFTIGLGFGLLVMLLVCLCCKFREHRNRSTMYAPFREASLVAPTGSHPSINSMLAPY